MRLSSNNILIESIDSNLAIQWAKDSFSELKDFDFIKFEYFAFRRKDAMYLRELLAQSGSGQVYVLNFFVTNQEAQNALLKITEELKNNILIIIVFDKYILLPTILSRFTSYSLNNSIGQELAQDFLALDFDKRIKHIDKLKTSEEGKIQLAKLIFSLQEYANKNPEKIDKNKLMYILKAARAYFAEINPLKPALESLAFL